MNTVFCYNSVTSKWMKLHEYATSVFIVSETNIKNAWTRKSIKKTNGRIDSSMNQRPEFAVEVQNDFEPKKLPFFEKYVSDIQNKTKLSRKLILLVLAQVTLVAVFLIFSPRSVHHLPSIKYICYFFATAF